MKKIHFFSIVALIFMTTPASAWDLPSFHWDGTTIPLSGSWGFYRSQLLSPDDLAGLPPPPMSTIPGLWHYTDQPDAGYGHGTYVLRLEGKNLQNPAILMPWIGNSHRLFVNGRPDVSRAGLVGNSPQTSRGERSPGLVWLPPAPDGVWNLVLQVSNYEDISGGISGTPLFGEARDLVPIWQWRLGSDLFLSGSLLLIGLYHLGIFFFRRNDRSPLWFGMMALLLALRQLVDNNLTVLFLQPNLSWDIILRLNYLTFTLMVVIFPQFTASLFPKQTKKSELRLIQVIPIAYSVLVISTPMPFYTNLLAFFQIYTVFLCIWNFAFIGRAVWARETGSRVFVAGTVGFFLATVHDMVKVHLVLPTPPLVPMGLSLFLLFQALVIARKFTTSFSEVERVGKQLRRVNESLERFIPREVLGFLKKESIVDIELGDHAEARMTVLFCDIRDFTALSESLSPKENFEFINSYLNRMGPLIRQNGGFVDKYMGDGIMALFPGEPVQALAAARDMLAELDRYNLGRAAAGYSSIRVGIGIHTGELMVGTIGEHGRMDSTVISDAVNLASRLEGLTKTFGKTILVSESVVSNLPEAEQIAAQFLGEEQVKGKRQPVKVYAIDNKAPA